MTREKAIEIVVETAKKCSWFPPKWEYVAVATTSPDAGCGQGLMVGWYTKAATQDLREKGCRERAFDKNGWEFSRKWLEDKGYL